VTIKSTKLPLVGKDIDHPPQQSQGGEGGLPYHCIQMLCSQVPSELDLVVAPSNPCSIPPTKTTRERT